jgi:2-keto-4-pentenoate hydratase/2-oxohepta-3-ene-1,7-dioic acid hydratase in catechol pathway
VTAPTAWVPARAVGRVGPAGSERPVVHCDGRWFDARPVTDDIGPDLLGSGGLASLFDAADAGRLPVTSIEGDRIGPPVAGVRKIVCIGLNYRCHAAETGATPPDEPVVFMKDPGCIVGPDDDVLIPRASTKTDWEVELAVVIGRTARYLADPSEAQRHIAGYSISNDVSEREFQLERSGQWDKGKSCETFNPLGPWLVPAVAIADVQALGLRLDVNGAVRQDSSTANMIFPVDHLIWYLSQFMVLRPGDVVNTGTPAGVALGLPGNPYLRAGDVVDVHIAGVGHQRHTFHQA